MILGCVGGCGVFETLNHLFMDRNYFNAIWVFIRQWLQYDSVHPSSIVDHFIQFGYPAGSSKLWCSILHII